MVDSVLSFYPTSYLTKLDFSVGSHTLSERGLPSIHTATVQECDRVQSDPGLHPMLWPIDTWVGILLCQGGV